MLLNYCEKLGIPFLYASSAATYGGSEVFKEAPEYEKPLNVYGYSKLLFDQHVRSRWNELTTQVVGFRYFNYLLPLRVSKIVKHQSLIGSSSISPSLEWLDQRDVLGSSQRIL